MKTWQLIALLFLKLPGITEINLVHGVKKTARRNLRTRGKRTRISGRDMRVCGVELKAADAIVVVLEGNKESFEIVDTGVQKISLRDTNNSEDVQAFHEAIHAFVQKHQIDKIGIKKRNTKGRFAGGATSFKMEGIIQLAQDATVALIAPASIASTIKKEEPPAANKLFTYQKGAYETAYTLLRSL